MRLGVWGRKGVARRFKRKKRCACCLFFNAPRFCFELCIVVSLASWRPESRLQFLAAFCGLSRGLLSKLSVAGFGVFVLLKKMSLSSGFGSRSALTQCLIIANVSAILHDLGSNQLRLVANGGFT